MPALMELGSIADTEGVPALAYSPDSRLLAVTHPGSGEPSLFDASTLAPAAKLASADASYEAVVFSPDGSVVAAGAQDGIVRAWRVEGGALIRTSNPQGAPIRALAFSPDGTTLAVGWSADFDPTTDGEGGLALLRADTLRESRQIRVDQAGYPGIQIAYTPDGATLVVGQSPALALEFYDTSSWTKRVAATSDFQVPIQAHFAISPDGEYIALTPSTPSMRVGTLSEEPSGTSTLTRSTPSSRRASARCSPRARACEERSGDGTLGRSGRRPTESGREQDLAERRQGGCKEV